MNIGNGNKMEYKYHKFANIFPMIEGKEFQELKKDIQEQGLQQTIILYEGQILDGRNRYKACKELNIKPRFDEYKGDKPLEFVISGNLKRRHLTPDQKAVVAQEVMPMLEEEAEKRLHLAKGKGIKGMEIIPQVKKKIEKENKSSVKASKIFNVNEKYIRDVKKLKEEGRIEDIEAIRSGKKRLVDIKKEDRKKKVEKQIEEIKKDNLERPNGLYDVIVIDPPWKVDFDYSPEHYMGRVANPYPEMDVNQIKKIKLPVKDNAILWLWTTHSQIWNAIDIMNHWGFEYKCILVWDKESIGIGKWLRKQCEFCLLGTKGKPIWTATDFRDIIREQKTNHSTKPEGFYKLIDKYCVGKKLDYFSRKKREGWDCYGDEISNKNDTKDKQSQDNLQGDT